MYTCLGCCAVQVAMRVVKLINSRGVCGTIFPDVFITVGFKSRRFISGKVSLEEQALKLC